MIRRTVIAGLVAATAAITLVVPASPAYARACSYGSICTTYWYSDAAHTNMVGSLYEECDGSIYKWGTHGSYVTFREDPC
ncbi:hypothetical protein Lfu02_49290 [Longispora fulva]|uniref:Peptidase inhibitor family I36 n=1 Tax=Longispora fulva TaxID=619741 RepID=A0A8J7KLS2_9ACTN|nr:DUF6289 family protein [Longispora fulva]MBG6138306.1 hypothetical protein [Longispora fulva]GIG60557.1 hypothetical protein Lfu02_49290 [Longispora fulva]